MLGRAPIVLPAVISNLSNVAVIAPRSFLCIAIRPARLALVKNASRFEPVSVNSAEIFTNVPPLTA